MPVEWGEFEADAPEFAAFVRGRIEAHGLALLATLRADGSPRISGLEPFFGGGQLWLGMMPRSVKVADLRRDGRFALHSATTDKDVAEGDVKISGVASYVTDADDFAVARGALGQHGPPEPGDMELFKAELTEVASVQVGGDHLIISNWKPGQPVQVHKRY